MRTTMLDCIRIFVPEDGAVDGYLHPKWDEACQHAADQINGRVRPEDANPEDWALQILREARTIRNKYLAEV